MGSLVGDQKRTARPTAVAAFIAGAICLAAPTVVHLDGPRDALTELSAVRRDEQFVELAFPNPSSVRNFVRSDGSTTLTFTVTSRLKDTAEARWTVYSQSDDDQGPVVYRQQGVVLEPRQTLAERVSFDISCTSRTQIVVHLDVAGGSGQSIHFYAAPNVSSVGRVSRSSDMRAPCAAA